MKRKGIVLILMAASVVITLTGCKKNVGTPEDNAVVEEVEEDDRETEGGRLIGLSCPDMEEPFYKVLKESIRTELEAQGDELMFQNADQGVQEQEAQIREMMESGIDALLLWPVDSMEEMPVLDELDEADIPVIALGGRLEIAGSVKAFVGSDEENAGKVCAEDLKERRPDGGNTVIIEQPDLPLYNERITGFEETIANSGFEVARINAGQGEEAVKSDLKEMLDSDSVPDAVMCADDRMALWAEDVLKEKGRTNVFLYSVGGSPEVKAMLAEPGNVMTAAGAQSPINIGKEAVKTLTAVIDGKRHEKEIYVDTFLIDRGNVDMYGTDGWQ